MSTLHAKTALVIGAGGLGGPAALTLASCGVGRILLVDPASVEAQDLAGQPLLREEDLGLQRSAAAARGLARRFPAVAFEVLARGLDARGVPELVRSSDVVVDASNHFPTMFLANDSAAAAGRPLVHAGVLHYTAQLLTVVPGETGCLRCLFEEPPPGPGAAAPEAEALGPLAGFAGALLATEALRVLEGEPGAYAGRLLLHEARSGRSRSVPVKRREGCAACGARAGTGAAVAGGAG